LKFPVKFILLLALFAFGNASAITLDFTCITGNSVANCANEDRFSVAVDENLSLGGTNFLFKNALGIGNPAIHEIYFDSSLLDGIVSSDDTSTSEVLLFPGSAVEFTLDSLSPPNLPGHNLIGFETNFGTEATGNANALQEGEVLTVTILSLLFSDFTAALADDFRIGIHVHSFNDGGSESFVTPPSAIPVPAAFWLFGTALIGFIGMSRRTKV
jgi:hypothetical protein